MPIASELQKLHQESPFIELFELDCTVIGGSLYRFTPHPTETGSVTFLGQAYLSFPVMSEGWEVTSTGTQPRPTLTVSNVNNILLNAIETLGDLVGARVVRRRTYFKFLDDQPTAAAEQLPVDRYYIEQKLSHTSEVISFQLASPIDRFGTMLPRRQVLRDRGFPGAGRYRGVF